MELSSSAITGTLRVGLQVATNHKRPVLEIYHEVRNRFGPETEFKIPVGIEGTKTETSKHRFQDIFIQFMIVNIGSVRALEVELKIEGKLKRNFRDEFLSDWFDQTIPQFAPGQSHYLFRFDSEDLNIYAEGGGKPLGIKDDSFTITISYNSPGGLMNWFLALPSKIRGKKQYVETYTFYPKMVTGDLPPAEYA